MGKKKSLGQEAKEIKKYGPTQENFPKKKKGAPSGPETPTKKRGIRGAHQEPTILNKNSFLAKPRYCGGKKYKQLGTKRGRLAGFGQINNEKSW